MSPTFISIEKRARFFISGITLKLPALTGRVKPLRNILKVLKRLLS
jgi:hypothetical protein